LQFQPTKIVDPIGRDGEQVAGFLLIRDLPKLKQHPGLLPRAMLVHESRPTWGYKPIFLSPPPELRLTNDVAFRALDAALYKVIFYI
jgi:hypothetical protein